MANWWLDEQAYAGAEHLDDVYVAGYDTKAQFDPTEDVELLQGLGMGPGSKVIDLGAGTGVFAAAAAAVGATVTAVDVSPAMVAAMAASPSGVTVAQAGFLSYEHTDEPADFVFSRNALHQIPDFWKAVALRRVAMVLRPGGVLRLRDLAYDLDPDGGEAALDEWMTTAVEDPGRGHTADEFATHVRDEFSTFTWLLEPILERAGFEIVEREVRRSVYAAYTCRRR